MAQLPFPELKKSQLKIGKKVKLSGWLVFDGIALIVIVAVVTLRLTHAGANYTFMRTPDQMSMGTMGRNVASGSYRHVAAEGVHGETTATVVAADVAASRQVCADMHVNSAKTFVDIQLNGHYGSKYVEQPGDVTVCAEVNNENQGGTVYAGTSGDVNVVSIYGTR